MARNHLIILELVQYFHMRLDIFGILRAIHMDRSIYGIISVCFVLFCFLSCLICNTAALEDSSPEALCDYTDFYIEYYYTTPPENGEYFYIGQEGRPEPDEVIQVTLRFVNDGNYPVANGRMVITENDVAFLTAEDFAKTRPGKYTEFGFPAMGTMGSDTKKYFHEESGRGVKHIHVVADFDVVTLDESLNVSEILDHLTRELEFDIPIGYREIRDPSADASAADIPKKESQHFTVVERLETEGETGSNHTEDHTNRSYWYWMIGTIVFLLLIGTSISIIFRKRKRNG